MNSFSAPVPGYSDPRIAAFASADARRAFIQRTYLTLFAAIVGFIAIIAVIFAAVPQQTLESLSVGAFGRWIWLAILVGFMGVGWLARAWAESDRSAPVQYAGLILYVIAQAVLTCPLLVVANLYTGDSSLIPAAGGITLMTFAGLTAVTFITKSDFSFMRMFLWWAGILAIGLIFIALVFGLPLGVWFSIAMIGLASAYILYDTSNVLHHFRTDQHVAAALALFASVALLFWYVVRLLMVLQRDR